MKKRIIARLDIKRDKLIKGIHLEGLRVVGDPRKFAIKYYEQNIDEIILLDSLSTLHGRNTLAPVISEITESIFIPITVGGGISSVEDAKHLFDAGADKISLNTAAVQNYNLLEKLSSIFGSQAIVLSLQVKLISNNYTLMTHNGREKSDLNLLDWIKIAQESGVGEILITSIDSEGTMKGFDLNLLDLLHSNIDVPYICSGGISNSLDSSKCFNNGAQAVAIARAFHYNFINPSNLKKELLNSNINLRNN
ncbi:imidazole glycerol phosphate synthase subunit HisF [bacterium]|nr:imidazole glycerol phosphate synthase subunit HisF [bacterium]|tara:strand:- start:4550 stop:5302 length:753 start_codon:yes stop_codon:yes gene_type:complete